MNGQASFHAVVATAFLCVAGVALSQSNGQLNGVQFEALEGMVISPTANGIRVTSGAATDALRLLGGEVEGIRFQQSFPSGQPSGAVAVTASGELVFESGIELAQIVMSPSQLDLRLSTSANAEFGARSFALFDNGQLVFEDDVTGLASTFGSVQAQPLEVLAHATGDAFEWRLRFAQDQLFEVLAGQGLFDTYQVDEVRVRYSSGPESVGGLEEIVYRLPAGTIVELSDAALVTGPIRFAGVASSRLQGILDRVVLYSENSDAPIGLIMEPASVEDAIGITTNVFPASSAASVEHSMRAEYFGLEQDILRLSLEAGLAVVETPFDASATVRVRAFAGGVLVGQGTYNNGDPVAIMPAGPDQIPVVAEYDLTNTQPAIRLASQYEWNAVFLGSGSTASADRFEIQLETFAGQNSSGALGPITQVRIGSTGLPRFVAVPLEVESASACLADTNGDGLVTPADFNAWILAYNANQPACDQNEDGQCSPADFNAWILNYNAGCE
ncbi:MAG: GC-type dockerin domain-anchored protein [Phycisphaerales bacterium]